jgi:CheY-like chemotaxis protein
MSRILIADDEPMVRTLLRVLLRSAGHEVREARDGSEAVQACREADFDLIVCDLLMPAMDGLETIRELRRDHPRLKVVAMTGGGGLGAGVDLLRMATLMGADASVRKPFSRQDLLDVIEEALGIKDGVSAASGPPGAARE